MLAAQEPSALIARNLRYYRATATADAASQKLMCKVRSFTLGWLFRILEARGFNLESGKLLDAPLSHRPARNLFRALHGCWTLDHSRSKLGSAAEAQNSASTILASLASLLEVRESQY